VAGDLADPDARRVVQAERQGDDALEVAGQRVALQRRVAEELRGPGDGGGEEAVGDGTAADGTAGEGTAAAGEDAAGELAPATGAGFAAGVLVPQDATAAITIAAMATRANDDGVAMRRIMT
jgi:hypothetical protein